MGKKYYGAEEILNNCNDDLTKKEISYKKIMTGKPNFDKTIQIDLDKTNHKENSKVIFRKKNFIILELKKNRYIVLNKKKKFKDGHTHTNNYNYAKSLIDLCVRRKLPRKPQKRIMESLKRLSNDEKYLKELEKFKGEKKKNANTDDEG